jgi:hypothetical protein
MVDMVVAGDVVEERKRKFVKFVGIFLVFEARSFIH